MSIPSNIVEGRGQKFEREFARFLRIALNSASELEYHLITARDTRAITGQSYLVLTTQVVEVRKMLHGLLTRIDAQRAYETDRPNAD